MRNPNALDVALATRGTHGVNGVRKRRAILDVFASRRHHNGFEFGVLAVSTSTPVSVMASVCSYCALLPPSAVTAVHPSGHVLVLCVPSLTIGSMVNVIPGRIVPAALFLA